jgi:hypothetical protein
MATTPDGRPGNSSDLPARAESRLGTIFRGSRQSSDDVAVHPPDGLSDALATQVRAIAEQIFSGAADDLSGAIHARLAQLEGRIATSDAAAGRLMDEQEKVCVDLRAELNRGLRACYGRQINERDTQRVEVETLIELMSTLDERLHEAVMRLDDAMFQIEALRRDVHRTEVGVVTASRRAVEADVNRDMFEAVWETAPLRSHLIFVREMLDRAHPLRPALDEGLILDQIRQKRADFEEWVDAYPLLFAESATRLRQGALLSDGGALAPVERLAHAVRERSEAALQAALDELGVRWIEPKPGDPVGDACAVAGDETAAAGMPTGSVARVARLGFVWRGRVRQPALVWRVAGPSTMEQPATSENSSGVPVRIGVGPDDQHADGLSAVVGTQTFDESPVSRPLGPEGWPDWLRAPSSRVVGLGGVVTEEIAALRSLVDLSPIAGPDGDAIVRNAMLPLRSLLGARGPRRGVPGPWNEAIGEQRSALLAWLSEPPFGVTLLVATERDSVNLTTMEVTGTRATAFASDVDTVAKVEAVGLSRREPLACEESEERVLLPARVVRYVVGGIDRA